MYYFMLASFVPALLLVLIGTISVYILYRLMKSPGTSCESCGPCEIVGNCFEDIMVRVNKFFLIEFVEQTMSLNVELKHPGEDETTKLIQRTGNGELKAEKKYFLYGVEVHYRVLHALFIVFLTVFGVSFVLFWNTFMADEKIGCDNEWDCFVKDSYFPIGNAQITTRIMLSAFE